MPVDDLWSWQIHIGGCFMIQVLTFLLKTEMLSIQIDTKSLELVIYYQLNNIKLSFFAKSF